MKLENLFEANTGETYIAQIAGTGEDYSWDLINASNKQEATKIAKKIGKDLYNKHNFTVHKINVYTLGEYVDDSNNKKTRVIRQRQADKYAKQSVKSGESKNVDRSTSADD